MGFVHKTKVPVIAAFLCGLMSGLSEGGEEQNKTTELFSEFLEGASKLLRTRSLSLPPQTPPAPRSPSLPLNLSTAQQFQQNALQQRRTSTGSPKRIVVSGGSNSSRAGSQRSSNTQSKASGRNSGTSSPRTLGDFWNETKKAFTPRKDVNEGIPEIMEKARQQSCAMMKDTQAANNMDLTPQQRLFLIFYREIIGLSHPSIFKLWVRDIVEHLKEIEPHHTLNFFWGNDLDIMEALRDIRQFKEVNLERVFKSINFLIKLRSNADSENYSTSASDASSKSGLSQDPETKLLLGSDALHSLYESGYLCSVRLCEINPEEKKRCFAAAKYSALFGCYDDAWSYLCQCIDSLTLDDSSDLIWLKMIKNTILGNIGDSCASQDYFDLGTLILKISSLESNLTKDTEQETILAQELDPEAISLYLEGVKKIGYLRSDELVKLPHNVLFYLARQAFNDAKGSDAERLVDIAHNCFKILIKDEKIAHYDCNPIFDKLIQFARDCPDFVEGSKSLTLGRYSLYVDLANVAYEIDMQKALTIYFEAARMLFPLNNATKASYASWRVEGLSGVIKQVVDADKDRKTPEEHKEKYYKLIEDLLWQLSNKLRGAVDLEVLECFINASSSISQDDRRYHKFIKDLSNGLCLNPGKYSQPENYEVIASLMTYFCNKSLWVSAHRLLKNFPDPCKPSIAKVSYEYNQVRERKKEAPGNFITLLNRMRQGEKMPVNQYITQEQWNILSEKDEESLIDIVGALTTMGEQSRKDPCDFEDYWEGIYKLLSLSIAPTMPGV